MSVGGSELTSIEGGEAGGGSARQASERRSIIARLAREADWLESVADDQRTTGQLLATLADDWSVLHDLQWTDAETAPAPDGRRPSPHVLDHLVVGPGGVFAIVTRRFAVPITTRDGQLWVGDVTLADELVAVLRGSQSLANALGTPVAPVMAFHGDTLPAEAPAASEGVLLCPVGDVAAVVARFPHTMLLPHERSGLVEQVLPLMISPGTSTRRQQAAPSPPREPDVRPQPVSNHEPSAAPTAPTAPSASRAPRVPRGPQGKSEPVETPPSRRRWPVVLLVVLLGVALIAGGLWWFLGPSGTDSSSIGGSVTTMGPGTDPTTEPSTSGSGVALGDLASGVAAPTLSVSLVCPGEGEGWQIVPDWPGDVDNLSSYDIEVQADDGQWTHLTLLESRDLSVAALSAQPTEVTFSMRATAVMLDMSRAEGTPVEVATPAEAC